MALSFCIAIWGGGAPLGALTLAGYFVIIGLVMALTGRANELIVLMLLANLIQRPLGAIFESSAFFWLDDVMLLPFGVFAILRAFQTGVRRWHYGLVILVLAMSVAVLRSPDLANGVFQFRQLMVPVVLVLVGSLLREDELRRVSKWVIAFVAINCAYAVGEAFGFRPVDPIAGIGVNEFTSGVNSAARELPRSYYYYLGGTDTVLTRSGGLVINPPAMGILAASGVIWLRRSYPTLTPPVLVLHLLFSSAAVLAIGRAGFIILALAYVQPGVARRLGRIGFSVAVLVIGSVAYYFFVGDGLSVRHVNGALEGLLFGASNPAGGGFGFIGNVVNHDLYRDEKVAGESLLSILWHGVGWLGILVCVWVFAKIFQRPWHWGAVAMLGAMTAATFSESASTLDSTVPIWLMAGTLLASTSVDGQSRSEGERASVGRPHRRSP